MRALTEARQDAAAQGQCTASSGPAPSLFDYMLAEQERLMPRSGPGRVLPPVQFFLPQIGIDRYLACDGPRMPDMLLFSVSQPSIQQTLPRDAQEFSRTDERDCQDSRRRSRSRSRDRQRDFSRRPRSHSRDRGPSRPPPRDRSYSRHRQRDFSRRPRSRSYSRDRGASRPHRRSRSSDRSSRLRRSRSRSSPRGGSRDYGREYAKQYARDYARDYARSYSRSHAPSHYGSYMRSPSPTHQHASEYAWGRDHGRSYPRHRTRDPSARHSPERARGSSDSRHCTSQMPPPTPPAQTVQCGPTPRQPQATSPAVLSTAVVHPARNLAFDGACDQDELPDFNPVSSAPLAEAGGPSKVAREPRTAPPMQSLQEYQALKGGRIPLKAKVLNTTQAQTKPRSHAPSDGESSDEDEKDVRTTFVILETSFTADQPEPEHFPDELLIKLARTTKWIKHQLDNPYTNNPSPGTFDNLLHKSLFVNAQGRVCFIVQQYHGRTRRAWNTLFADESGVIEKIYFNSRRVPKCRKSKMTTYLYQKWGMTKGTFESRCQWVSLVLPALWSLSHSDSLIFDSSDTS